MDRMSTNRKSLAEEPVTTEKSASIRRFNRSCCQMAVAVGIPVAWYPPRGSVRALISAYGSYLG
jgi:hypothetical protein